MEERERKRAKPSNGKALKSATLGKRNSGIGGLDIVDANVTVAEMLDCNNLQIHLLAILEGLN